MSTDSGQPRQAPPATPIALLGAGVMGRTLLASWLRSDFTREDLLIVERDADRAAALTEKYGVRVVDHVEAVKLAKTVVIVVKPQDVVGLCTDIAPHMVAGSLVVSMAAGITTSLLERHLPAKTAVARVMPNTPALVSEGMSAVSPGQHCSEQQLAQVCQLLRATGAVITIPEHRQDAVTAISGSGPAYLFYVVEAMIEAGVLLGLPRDTANDLVVQTLYGAAAMIKETGEHPTVLRERVSSPAGTTVAALRQLDDHKVRAAFLTAMEAACHRSRELSGE